MILDNQKELLREYLSYESIEKIKINYEKSNNLKKSKNNDIKN